MIKRKASYTFELPVIIGIKKKKKRTVLFMHSYYDGIPWGPCARYSTQYLETTTVCEVLGLHEYVPSYELWKCFFLELNQL